MRVEFIYAEGIPPKNKSVILDHDSHESARRAVRAAERVGLGTAIFSYSEILATVPEGQNEIEICAVATGTAYEEQLKSIFVADAPISGQSMPNAAVVLLRHPDRIDFQKLADELGRIRRYGDKPIGTLRFRNIDRLGIPRGFLGINPRHLMVPTYFTPPQGESFDPYTEDLPSSLILDESLRELSRFCMLAGYRRADALVVIGGGEGRLGMRLDAFFNSYLDESAFAVADIREG